LHQQQDGADLASCNRNKMVQFWPAAAKQDGADKISYRTKQDDADLWLVAKETK
jgi:hypothetical protein